MDKLVFANSFVVLQPRVSRHVRDRSPQAVPVPPLVRKLRTEGQLVEYKWVGGAVRSTASNLGTRPKSVPIRDTRSRSLMVLRLRDEIGEQVAQELSSDETIEFAQVPAIRYPQSSTSAIDDNVLWHLKAIGYWSASEFFPTSEQQRTVRIGMIDTGINLAHPTFSGRAIHRRVFNSDASSDTDPAGHGTSVASLMIGAPSAEVRCRGMCDASFFSYAAVPHTSPWDPFAYYSALRAAIDDELHVLNISLAGDHDIAEEKLIADLVEAGTIVVCAAGNFGHHGNPDLFPAALDNVIAVGAVNNKLERAEFSNHGPHVKIHAPGAQVFAAVNDSPGQQAAPLDGTSFAAPLVSAAAALASARAGRPLTAREFESFLNLSEGGADRLCVLNLEELMRAIDRGLKL